MIRVLLVEDDVLLARQFLRVLEASGMMATHVRHVGEAVVAIDEQVFDCIVLDVLLPATSGFALLHELQSYDDTVQLPVVMCTSMADTMQLEELRTYGVRRLLDKASMHPEELAAAVRAVT